MLKTEVSPEIQAKVFERINACLKIAEQKFGKTFKFPNVHFEIDNLKWAGSANASTWTVKFNPCFLNAETEKFINRTVVHEIAHLIHRSVRPEDFLKDRRKLHGAFFRYLMEMMGSSDTSAKHSYKLSSVGIQVKVFVYECEYCSRQYKLLNKKHNEMQKSNETKYRCFCKGPISFIETRMV